MKQVLFLIMLITGLSACQKDSEIISKNEVSKQAIFQGISFQPAPGSWNIVSLRQNGWDISGSISIFNITMNPDNSASLASSFIEFRGKWELIADQMFLYFEIDAIILGGGVPI